MTSPSNETILQKIDHQPVACEQFSPTVIIEAQRKSNNVIIQFANVKLRRASSKIAAGVITALPQRIVSEKRKQWAAAQREAEKAASKKGEAKVSHDENQERGNWSNQIEFVISCIGFAVGLGNVWRFPYVCYKNGGGAFLVIYWILSTLVGFPIIVAEQSIGQYTSQGPLHCWQFAPIITGVGLSMVAVSFITAIYYDIIITWATYYLFASFTTKLPWEGCDFSTWADFRCEMQQLDCRSGSGLVRGFDGLCYNATAIGLNLTEKVTHTTGPNVFEIPNNILSSIVRNSSTVVGYWNETLADAWGFKSALASAQYYHNFVLGDGDSSVNWSNFGQPRWALVLCLLLVWCLIYCSLLNGIKTSGKIVYVTALAPYAVLFILIVRGATLPGAQEGIMYFLTPDFEQIQKPEVWYAAAGQLFYSLSACWGGMVTLASYNRFQNNIIRDALIVVFADTFTSFFASFAIFSVIGYGAKLLNRPVDKVVEAGAGLAFIVYPKVLSSLPGAVGFSVIFFLMLICIGMSSQFNFVQTVYTAILDMFPALRLNRRTKYGTLAIVCVVCFLLGLPFVCPGGPALLQLFDAYCATWAILLMGILETLTLCWVYGFRRYSKDLKLMMKWLPVVPARCLMVALWGFITPGVLAFIMFFIWIRYEPRTDSTEEGVGWFLTWFVAIWMPVAAIWVVFTGKGSWKHKIKSAFRPTEKWGPYLSKFRDEAKHLKKVASIARSQTAPASLHELGDDSSPNLDGNQGIAYRVIHKRQRDEIPTIQNRLSYCESIETFELSDWQCRPGRSAEEREVAMTPMAGDSSVLGTSFESSAWAASYPSRTLTVEVDYVQHI